MKYSDKLSKINPIDCNKDFVFKEYLSLVKIISKQVIKSCDQNTDLDDLIQIGSIGLLDAIDKYKDNKKSFKCLARLRIKGEMLDYLKKQSGESRFFKDKYKYIQYAKEKFILENKKTPSNEEICKQADISLDEFYKITLLSTKKRNISIEEIKDCDKLENSLLKEFIFENQLTKINEQIDINKINEVIHSNLSKLDPRWVKIIKLHYFEEKSLTEISKILSIDVTRVYQIIKRSFEVLKPKLKKDLKNYNIFN